MSLRRLAPLAILALLASASLASAHVENYSQAKALQAGPFLVFFDLRPSPPFADTATSIVVQVSDSKTGTLQTRAPTTVLVAGPGEFSERKKMEPDGTGYMVASMVLPERGNYSARVFVQDDAGEQHAADTEFEVFPNIPFRIRPVDQTTDVIVGERAPLAFDVVDPVTLQGRELPDLRVRLEHWSEDHTKFLGSEETPTTKASPSVWRIEPVFNASGMYHIRFASSAGGFNYADVPLLHVYALSPAAAGLTDTEDTPAAGALLVLGALAAVALLLRRR